MIKNLGSNIFKTSPNGQIGESGEFASLIILVSYGSFTALFTGDSQAPELSQAISDNSIADIKILEAPHHGSKTGLRPEILSRLRPNYAIISVGAHNRYGHPAQLTLDLLDEFNVKTLRTSKNGDIEIITDGKNLQVR